jgi:hypothetical protein
MRAHLTVKDIQVADMWSQSKFWPKALDTIPQNHIGELIDPSQIENTIDI